MSTLTCCNTSVSRAATAGSVAAAGLPAGMSWATFLPEMSWQPPANNRKTKHSEHAHACQVHNAYRNKLQCVLLNGYEIRQGRWRWSSCRHVLQHPSANDVLHAQQSTLSLTTRVIKPGQDARSAETFIASPHPAAERPLQSLQGWEEEPELGLSLAWPKSFLEWQRPACP